jgi:hypothetical protein
MKRWTGRTLAALVLLTLTQMLAGVLLMPPAPQVPGTLGFLLLSNLLTAALVVRLAQLAHGDRLHRTLLLFAVLFGIPANYLVEALFFDLGIPRTLLVRIYAFNLVVAATVAAFVARGAGSPGTPSTTPRAERSPAAWMFRVAAASICYVVAYFTAGLAAYPFVADFYTGRIPDVGFVATLQVLRGLGFVGVAVVLVRGLAATRWGAALAVGLTLSVVGGIAPLLVPNAYLPTPVRLAHLVEVGLSNLVFGIAAGLILGSSANAAGAAELEAA